MKAGQWLQAASNLVSGMFGVFIGLAIEGFEGVEPWLSKWSTLIAGGLAVLAAFITIFQMARLDDAQARRLASSDEAQNRRHLELMALNLRSDRLKASRAALRAEFLKEVISELPTPDLGTSRDTVVVGLRIYNDVAASWIGKVAAEIEHDAVEEVLSLLEPGTALALERAKKAIQGAKNASVRLAHLRWEFEQGAGTAPSTDELRIALARLQTSARAVCFGLEKLLIDLN